MKKVFKFFGLCLPILVISTLKAQQIKDDSTKLISLPFTREHVIQSKINGREYYLWIALPISYRANDTAKYPVFYFLDGGYNFTAFTSMFRRYNVGKANDLILIGIDYCSAFTDQCDQVKNCGMRCRRVDYTPPAFPVSDTAEAHLQREWPGHGGGAVFHRILRDEIIPFVDKNYRTNSDRGIHGHSFGGLFVNYVLFEDPDLFNKYAITDPSLWWDDESMFLRETLFRKGRSSLAKKVYFGTTRSGGIQRESIQGTSNWHRMVSLLCWGEYLGNYKGLDLIAEIYDEEDHSSVVPLSRTLKVLYPGKEPPPGSFHNCGQPMQYKNSP